MLHMEGNTLMKLDGLLTRVVSQPQVRVKLFGTGADATIYNTNSVHVSQQKSNPFTGNADGSWDFYCPDTRVNVELSGGTPPLGATLVSSDNIGWDPFGHFDFRLGTGANSIDQNFNSGYLLAQNSAGLSTPTHPSSLGLVLAGLSYVGLTGVSCGNPSIRTNPGSGFPVLEVVMTGTGWLQAWRTSSGHGGAQTLRAYLSNLGELFLVGGIFTGLGTAATPTYSNSTTGHAGLYFPGGSAPGLTSSGGALTGILNAASGFVLSGKTFVGNACGLTTSSQIITASKALAVGDMGVTQVCSTATNITLTLSNGLDGSPGRVIPIFRAGAGTVTVTSGGAVTILGTQFTVNSLSGASLEWIATNVWLLRV